MILYNVRLEKKNLQTTFSMYTNPEFLRILKNSGLNVFVVLNTEVKFEIF